MCGVCGFASCCDFPEAVVLIENVAKVETGKIVGEALRSMGYVTRAYFINSASFGLPQSRTRLFVMAILPQKLALVQHPDSWHDHMEASSRVNISITPVGT